MAGTSGFCLCPYRQRHGNCIHANYESEIRGLHDSLRIEFTRLALEKSRTFADVLLIKEKTSQYRQDTELAQAVTDAESFFRSLDSVAPCHGNAKQTVSAYQSFLANTLKSGIDSKDKMLAFIQEEDRLFRSFLSHLPKLADADLSAITRDTEKCCLSVFQSAEDGKISYRDALIYTARRTNRRIILNALACRNDINQGNVKPKRRQGLTFGCCCSRMLPWMVSAWLFCPIWKGQHFMQSLTGHLR